MIPGFSWPIGGTLVITYLIATLVIGLWVRRYINKSIGMKIFWHIAPIVTFGWYAWVTPQVAQKGWLDAKKCLRKLVNIILCQQNSFCSILSTRHHSMAFVATYMGEP